MVTMVYLGGGQQNSNDYTYQPASVVGVPLGNILTEFGKFGISLGIVFPHLGLKEFPVPVIALGYRVHPFIQYRQAYEIPLDFR